MSGRSSLQNQILLVLAAGFVAGTFFVNFPGREYIGQFGIFSQDYREQILGGQLDMWGLFFYLLARRLAPLFFLVLFSYSRCKEPLLFLILLWMAFSLGICWSSCLILYQAKGILLFFGSFLPQGIPYVIGWAETIRSLFRYPRRSSDFFAPALILAMGAASEAWIHPHLLRILYGFFYF